ncbi:hypothetical protein CMV_028003, partial [Castanea mollissima]
SGGDRLSRALRHSTMGAGAFNGRVRDGIGFWARRSSHQTGATQFGQKAEPSACVRQACCLRATVSHGADTDHGSDQVNRAISTGRLNASPRLHPRPIDVVVFHGPQGRPKSAPTIQKVEGGFPHSEIPGSKLVRSSPRLIAAYHVLHRLSAPRHPPNALKALDRSHDRCPLTGSRIKRPRSRHGHKKTGHHPLSRTMTLCLPNMTAPDQLSLPKRPHSL